MEPRLQRIDHALHRRTGRAKSADELHSPVRRARYSVRFFPAVVRVYLDQRQALRLQLELRQSAAAEGDEPGVPRRRHEARGEHQAVPAAGSSTL
ncbi:hypothetical protein D3C86_1470520 [compost metagenome]